MTEWNECIKGLTDLPIAVITAVFAVLLNRRGCNRFAGLMLFAALTSLGGAAVHIFSFPLFWRNLFWVVLYFPLFELVRRFALLMAGYITGKYQKEKGAVLITEIAVYIFTVIMLYAVPFNEIIFFALFAAAEFLRVAVCLLKTRPCPKKAQILTLLLIFPLVIQLFSALIPYSVVWVHMFITAALFIAYSVGKEEKNG